MRKLQWFDLASLRKRFLNDRFRFFYQFKVLCFILACVALVMSFVNLFTEKWVLLLATSAFSVSSFLNYFIMCRRGRAGRLNYIIFDGSVICLFTYFLLTGGTAGFSPYWILLLSTCGMSFLGRKRGFVLSAIMLAETVLVLWIPFGRELLFYHYTQEFCMRFPIVYAAFFVVGYCFAWVYSAVYAEMQNKQRELVKIAEKDALTGLKNRFWFNKRFMAEFDHKISNTGSLALLMDIDGFKNINDVYGHLAGDAVLCCVSNTVRGCLENSGMLCRWGGEEFFAFVPVCSAENAPVLCERIRSAVETEAYEFECKKNIKVTLSIGAVCIQKNETIDIEKVLCEADRRLYHAKNQGKNQVSII